MSNPNPQTAHLLKQTPNWQHLPTKAIRVPEVFADNLLALAHLWDAQSEPYPHRWLGIDPGLATIRWAVLEGDGYDPKLLDYGTIQTAKKRPTPERLLELEQDLVLLLREFRPGNIALEMPIITSENPQNVRTVLEAVGVILLVCYRETGLIPVQLYPGMWKSNLGNGWASSEEVTDTIAAMFDLGEQGRTRLDAIGIALAGFSGVGR